MQKMTTEIKNVQEWLSKSGDSKDDAVILVQNIVRYLRVYNVAPKHYTMSIDMNNKWVMIQIDEQCGRVDKQVSKTNFEFINGTCFSINFDEIPDEDECEKLKYKIATQKIRKIRRFLA